MTEISACRQYLLSGMPNRAWFKPGLYKYLSIYLTRALLYLLLLATSASCVATEPTNKGQSFGFVRNQNNKPLNKHETKRQVSNF